MDAEDSCPWFMGSRAACSGILHRKRGRGRRRPGERGHGAASPWGEAALAWAARPPSRGGSPPQGVPSSGTGSQRVAGERRGTISGRRNEASAGPGPGAAPSPRRPSSHRCVRAEKRGARRKQPTCGVPGARLVRSGWDWSWLGPRPGPQLASCFRGSLCCGLGLGTDVRRSLPGGCFRVGVGSEVVEGRKGPGRWGAEKVSACAPEGRRLPSHPEASTDTASPRRHPEGGGQVKRAPPQTDRPTRRGRDAPPRPPPPAPRRLPHGFVSETKGQLRKWNARAGFQVPRLPNAPSCQVLVTCVRAA